jgi:hypothetical protein
MKLAFNVTKENKKAFAKAIGEITGEKAVYQFTPTYAFQIGDLTVNRDATLTAPDGKDLGSLLEALKAQGYELLEAKGAPEAEPQEETPAADEKTEADEKAPELTVSLPLHSRKRRNPDEHPLLQGRPDPARPRGHGPSNQRHRGQD